VRETAAMPRGQGGPAEMASMAPDPTAGMTAQRDRAGGPGPGTMKGPATGAEAGGWWPMGPRTAEA